MGGGKGKRGGKGKGKGREKEGESRGGRGRERRGGENDLTHPLSQIAGYATGRSSQKIRAVPGYAHIPYFGFLASRTQFFKAMALTYIHI